MAFGELNSWEVAVPYSERSDPIKKLESRYCVKQDIESSILPREQITDRIIVISLVKCSSAFMMS